VIVKLLSNADKLEAFFAVSEEHERLLASRTCVRSESGRAHPLAETFHQRHAGARGRLIPRGSVGGSPIRSALESTPGHRVATGVIGGYCRPVLINR
jgi:hypothetical protein